MFNDDTCTVVMRRACLLAGAFRAEGETIRSVPLAEAYESCALNDWARFADPRDEPRARAAAEQQLRQQLRQMREVPVPEEWRQGPWRAWP